MACGSCGDRTRQGTSVVYRYHPPNAKPRTFATQAEAEKARTDNGGIGAILRVAAR